MGKYRGIFEERQGEWEQWRRQNFSAAGAQSGHQNLDRRGTFKNYAFLLILAQFDAGAQPFPTGA